jgi:hypothetical protein
MGEGRRAKENNKEEKRNKEGKRQESGSKRKTNSSTTTKLLHLPKARLIRMTKLQCTRKGGEEKKERKEVINEEEKEIEKEVNQGPCTTTQPLLPHSRLI